MKRKFLEELGLEKDVIDKIMTENGNDINAAKAELSDVTAERDKLKQDIKEREGQIETLKKSAGSGEDLKKQIEALQAENRKEKISYAVEKALTAAKAKNVTAAKAMLKDLDKAEFSEDGSIKGLSEQIKALQKDEATKFLFEEEKKPQKPKMTGASPADPDDEKPSGVTKEQFAKMGYKERLKLYNSDRDAYDLLSGTKKGEE